MKVAALCLLSVFLVSVTLAHTSDSCGHNRVLRGLENFEEFYRNRVLEKEMFRNKTQSGIRPRMLQEIRVPIVWHVIHAGTSSATYISEDRINLEMTWLNEWFSAANTYYSSASSFWDAERAVAGDFALRFELADRDLNGDPFSGINYHESASVATSCDETNAFFTSQGGVDIWDPENYYNIYTCQISDGSLGFAYLPSTNSPPHSQDGCVLDYAQLGDSFYTGSTISHETGHFLGLEHTFAFESCSDDDGLDDTPNTDAPAFDYNDPQAPCPPFTTDAANQRCGNIVMVQNNMDYNQEECLSFFSKQQVDLMRFYLTDPSSNRVGLQSSPALDPNCPSFDCTEKTCGDDGCGGVCGTCEAGEVCNASQRCVVGGSSASASPSAAAASSSPSNSPAVAGSSSPSSTPAPAASSSPSNSPAVAASSSASRTRTPSSSADANTFSSFSPVSSGFSTFSSVFSSFSSFFTSFSTFSTDSFSSFTSLFTSFSSASFSSFSTSDFSSSSSPSSGATAVATTLFSVTAPFLLF